jgi:hypothetical protein
MAKPFALSYLEVLLLMKRHMLRQLRRVGLSIAAIAGMDVGVANAQILYSENFDGLTLMDSVNERLGFPILEGTAAAPPANSAVVPHAFTHTGPVGWDVDNTLAQYDGVIKSGYTPAPVVGWPTHVGVPGAGLADYGIDEWEGWSFANRDFWASVDVQQRDEFTKASGVVAVVDPDEYFDLGGGESDPVNGGYYNSGLKSPNVVVSPGEFYDLTFDSSWRAESFDDDFGPDAALNATNNQSAEVLAIFDNGATYVIQGWDSAGPTDPATGPVFKGDATNETVQGTFVAPAGASSVRFQFNMANAANDWWWAIDNLNMNHHTLDDMGNEVVTSEWTEGFESAPLGDSVNQFKSTLPSHVTAKESALTTESRPMSFTNDPSSIGWSIDNSGMPSGGIHRDDLGVYEWEGWSFATREFWNFADLQDREKFTKCVGNCAIADSDEFTDLGPSSTNRPMNTLLSSPEIPISAAAAGKLRLSFDSSWRAEDAQEAVVEVSYDGGPWEKILDWQSNEFLDPEETILNPNFHDDQPNESIFLALANPAGAATAKTRFSYLNGNNNWWWALDNVQVSAVPEPATGVLALLSAAGIFFVTGTRRGREEN